MTCKGGGDRTGQSDSDAIDATRNNRYSVASPLTLSLRMTAVKANDILFYKLITAQKMQPAQDIPCAGFLLRINLIFTP